MTRRALPSRHRDLVEQLVSDLRPVRRLWSPGRRWTAWIGASVVVTLAVPALLGVGMTPDVAAHLHDTTIVLGVALAVGAALLLAYLALCASVPGREMRRSRTVLIAAISAAALLFVAPQGADPRIGLRDFTTAGLPCLVMLLMVGVMPWMALLVAVGRGAPSRPRLAGALAAAAAFLMPAAMLSAMCPVVGRLHVLVWHVIPIGALTALSSVVLGVVLARYARPPLRARSA